MPSPVRTSYAAAVRGFGGKAEISWRRSRDVQVIVSEFMYSDQVRG